MYQQPQPLRAPAAVKLAASLIAVEAGLGLAAGLLILVGGLLSFIAGADTVSSEQLRQAIGLGLGAVGVAALIFAIIVLALSGFWMWVGVRLFRLSAPARWIAVALQGFFGLVALAGASHSTALLVYVAVTLLILYGLLIDPAGRRAFAAAIPPMPPNQVYAAPPPGQLVSNDPAPQAYPPAAYPQQPYPQQPYPQQPHPAGAHPATAYPQPATPPAAGAAPAYPYTPQPYPVPAPPAPLQPVPQAPPPAMPGPSHTDIPGHAGTPPPV